MRSKYSILKGGGGKSADDESLSSHNHAVEKKFHVHSLNSEEIWSQDLQRVIDVV